MKNARALLYLFLLPAAAFGQNLTTVTGSNLKYLDGSKVVAGKVCFQAVNANDTPMSFQAGGGGQVPIIQKCATVSNGAFTLSVFNTDMTQPAHICYDVIGKDSSGKVFLGGSPQAGYSCVQPTGSSWSFDTFIPNLVPGPQVIQGAVISGSPAAGDCAEWISPFLIGDAGAPCGSGNGTNGGADPTKLPLAGGTMTGPIVFASNQSWSTAARAGTGNCPSGQYETGDTTSGPGCTQIQISQISGAGSAATHSTSDFDSAGAASARAGTGNCPTGQYETGDATSGPNCAQPAYSQISGTPTLGTAAAQSSSSFDAAGAAAARAATGSCGANQYATAATTSGITCSQPSYSQISGMPTLGTSSSQNSTAFVADPGGNGIPYRSAAGASRTATGSDLIALLGYTPVNPSSLATVATSGSYNDLSNKPTLGTASAQNSTAFDSAGTAAARAGVGACGSGQYETGDATGGPTCAQVQYSQLSGTPTLGTAASQSSSAFDAAGAASARAAASACTTNQYATGTGTSNTPCAQVAYSQVTGTPSLTRTTACNIYMAGTSGAITSSDGPVPPAQCANIWSSTVTITSVKCMAGAAMTFTLADNSSSAIVSAACTCGVGSFGICTVSGSSWISGKWLVPREVSNSGGATWMQVQVTAQGVLQ